MLLNGYFDDDVVCTVVSPRALQCIMLGIVWNIEWSLPQRVHNRRWDATVRYTKRQWRAQGNNESTWSVTSISPLKQIYYIKNKCKGQGL